MSSGLGSTSSRKEEHVRLCTTQDVRFRSKTAGFERYDFDYVALPELDFEEIDTGTLFLGKPLALPLVITAMTGGYQGATAINAALAQLCQERRLALGLGSMRQLLEEDAHWESFRVARTNAPDIPLLANIGATQLVQGVRPEHIAHIVTELRADALAVHLNPLQELLQPEGTPRFRGVLAVLAELVQTLPVPVVVKEVGAGISQSVAMRLLDVGVIIIDVAGAGGTSWAGVELLRNGASSHPLHQLWDCGIPTADCVGEVSTLRSRYTFVLIASGGITTGFDAAKALILGADLVGMARPILQALQEGGVFAAHRLLEQWELQLKAAMFISGCATISALHQAHLRQL